jgi:SulP family sulfate permease
VIPMAALVAVMIFVSVATFDWHSLRTIHTMPRSETIVMLTTVAGTLITHNLAIGVGAGVLAACVLFARRVAHLAEVTSVTDPDGGTRVYSVTGALFFASSNDLYTQFDYAGDPDAVVIDLTDAHVWDASTVAALDAITHKYETRGKTVEIVGLSGHSADRFQRHSGQLAGAH